MRMLAPTFRILIVGLLLALPLLSVAGVGAQEQNFTPQAYTSQLSDFDIVVSGPVYAITGATLEHYSSGEGEIVTIESDVVSIEVSFFDDADTPEQTIDAYLAGIENADLDYTLIDRGIEAGVTYALTSIHYEGIDVFYYMQVTQDVAGNVDLFETILTTATTFEDDLAAAQNEITIDVAPFMETVVAADLVEAAASSPGSSTPESDSAPVTAETTVPFDTAGVSLGLGPDFQVTGDPVTDGSIQGYMVAGADTLTLVALGETGMSAEEVVESFTSSLDENYESVEQVDALVTDDFAWALYRVELDGQPRAMLVTADTALVPGFELLVSSEMPVTDVAASITSLQTGLGIDGQPLLANIDADDIAVRLGDGSTEPTPELVETPEATAGSTPSRPRDDAKLPTDGGAGNSSEIGGTPEATEEPVTQSDSSWESPVLGHVVEWDAVTWFVDVDDPSMVESDEAEQYESLTLTAELSPVISLLYIDMYGANDSTPDEYLAYWSSEEFLRHETSSGELFNGELVSTRSRQGRVAVVISYSNSDGDFYLIREAVATGDGSIMLLTLDTPASDVVAAYTAAQDDVKIDGGSSFSVFTPEQIQRATGN